MAAFHEVRFPDDISKGSTGGPTRQTDIIELVSGFEERNASVFNSRRSYDASMGLRNVNDLHDVIEFWEARFGQLYGFRWKDWTDYRSGRTANVITPNDQVIGTGNAVLTQFQLAKTYSSGSSGYARAIRKPVAGTVVVARNGVQALSGWTVDNLTGLVTFAAAPGSGVVVTAGFEFDVPVRFDADKLTVSIDAFNHGSIPTISIKEIRV